MARKLNRLLGDSANNVCYNLIQCVVCVAYNSIFKPL